MKNAVVYHARATGMNRYFIEDTIEEQTLLLLVKLHSLSYVAYQCSHAVLLSMQTLHHLVTHCQWCWYNIASKIASTVESVASRAFSFKDQLHFSGDLSRFDSFLAVAQRTTIVVYWTSLGWSTWVIIYLRDVTWKTEVESLTTSVCLWSKRWECLTTWLFFVECKSKVLDLYSSQLLDE